MKLGHRVLVAAWTAATSILIAYSGAAISAPAGKENAALRALTDATGGNAIVRRNVSGRVVHLRSAVAPLPVDPKLTSDARARSVINQYRDALLDDSTALDLVTTRVAPVDATGRSYVRYQQRINGLPVRGGELIVHLDKRGVTAIHSNLQSGIAGLKTQPAINSDAAIASAERDLGRRFLRARLTFTKPQLEIVDVDQLRGKSGGSARLAWFTEAQGPNIREMVWVDAQSGDVLLHFSQVAHAFIGVSDYADSCLDPPPTNPPFYDATSPPPSGSDAEAGLNNITAAYDFVKNSYSWLGFDGADAISQSAVVRVCDTDPVFTGVPEMAEWFKENGTNTAGQMIFGPGIAFADDVVGHEYVHGITEYSSQLNLVGESGALAEGISDALGEAIDQLQNTANDTGDARWAFGEDATGGPFRNLMTPDADALPGKVTDTNFYCGSNDSVWIHRNGAVIAHAFALLADGGTYNGVTITGIGVANAAKIFFKTLTEHLNSTSKFSDAYDAFYATADALVTSGEISTSDKAQLANVLNAIELNAGLCGAARLNYCPAGQSAVAIFSDDFEVTNSGKWTNSVASGVNHWSDAGNDGAAVGTPAIYFAADPDKGIDPTKTVPTLGLKPYRGSYALWAATERRANVAGRLGDSNVAMSSAVALAAGINARMQFEGRFAFETASTVADANGVETTTGPDGGIVEYSVNGGAWQNATALLSAGQGYNGTIQADAVPPNPLGNQPGFVGSSPNVGYVSTQLDLSSLAGQSVQFRFRVGTDNWVDAMGWQIDDMKIYSCSNAALVVSPTDGLSTSESGTSASFTVHLSGAPSDSVTIKVVSSDTGEGTVSPAELVFNSSNYSQDQTVTVTGVDDTARDGSVGYSVTVSVDQTNDPGYQGATSVELVVTNIDNDKKKGGGALSVSMLSAMLCLALIHAGVFIQRRRNVRRL